MKKWKNYKNDDIQIANLEEYIAIIYIHENPHFYVNNN
jgi:hypothetical protein